MKAKRSADFIPLYSKESKLIILKRKQNFVVDYSEEV
jgi:hypothetical protein